MVDGNRTSSGVELAPEFETAFNVVMFMFCAGSALGFMLNSCCLFALPKTIRLSKDAKILLYNTSACGIIMSLHMWYRTFRALLAVCMGNAHPRFSPLDCTPTYFFCHTAGMCILFTVLAVGWERALCTRRVLANQQVSTAQFGVIGVCVSWLMASLLGGTSLINSIINRDMSISPIVWCYTTYAIIHPGPYALVMATVLAYFVFALVSFEMIARRTQRVLDEFKEAGTSQSLEKRLQLKQTARLMYAVRSAARFAYFTGIPFAAGRILVWTRVVSFSQPTLNLMSILYGDFAMIGTMLVALPCSILLHTEPSGSFIRTKICHNQVAPSMFQAEADVDVGDLYLNDLAKQWKQKYRMKPRPNKPFTIMAAVEANHKVSAESRV